MKRKILPVIISLLCTPLKVFSSFGQANLNGMGSASRGIGTNRATGISVSTTDNIIAKTNFTLSNLQGIITSSSSSSSSARHYKLAEALKFEHLF